MIKALADVAAEPAEVRMRFQALLERAASAAEREDAPVPGPYLTISREANSGGTEIAARVGSRLGWSVLDRELDHVRRSGAEVLTIEPTEEDLGVMAGDPMAHRRGADVAEQAYRSVLRHHG